MRFYKGLFALFIAGVSLATQATTITLEFNPGNNVLLPYEESGFLITSLGGPGDEGVGDGSLYDNDLALGEEIRFTLTHPGSFSFLSFDLFTGFIGELHSAFRFTGLVNGAETWSSDIFAVDPTESLVTYDGFNTSYFDEFRIRGMGQRDNSTNLAVWDNFSFDVLRTNPPGTPPNQVSEPATHLLFLLILVVALAVRTDDPARFRAIRKQD